MATIALPSVVLNGRRIQLHDNSKYFTTDVDGTRRKKNCLERCADYFGSANGVFRGFQTVQKVIAAILVIFHKMSTATKEYLKDLGDKFMLAWTILTIPRIFGIIKDLKDACKRVKVVKDGEIPGTKARNTLEIVKHSTDLSAAVLYSLCTLTGKMGFKYGADVFDAANKTIEARMNMQTLSMAYADLKKAKVEHIDARVKTALQKTGQLSVLKLLNCICSIAGAILGLSLAIFGGPILPAILLIGVSIAGTAFAMWGTFFENASKHEMIDYFKTKHVQQVAVAA